MLVPNYLDKCKQVLDFDTDYKLAKQWEIDTGLISRYRSGGLKADNYLCFRIAETLHESPTKIIAELESENQRNEVKSLYFKRFFSIAGLWITLTIGSSICVTFSDSVNAAGDGEKTLNNQHNVTLYEVIKTLKTGLLKLLLLLKNERYFTCNWTRKAAIAAYH